MNKNEVSFLFICIVCLIEKTLEVHTYSVFKHEHTSLNPWNKYWFTLTPHMLSNKDEIPPWLCRKRAAAPLQTSDFQWIPTLWHFNKMLCHIASAQFGKRLKWRTWSWLAGTFGQNEIWSTHMSSSWKHPAIPYEVLIDPLSMPNPEVLNMEIRANSSGKTDDRGDTKVSCVAKQDALSFRWWTELFRWFICSQRCKVSVDVLQLHDQQVSEILHNSSTNMQMEHQTQLETWDIYI